MDLTKSVLRSNLRKAALFQTFDGLGLNETAMENMFRLDTGDN